MNYQYVYDLDDKINLLYDCVYNFTTKNSFLVDNINLQNITISDIKFIIPDKKNTLEVSEYNDIKDKIFNAKFKLLNFDEINYSCLLKRFSNQFSILIKINFYKQKNEIESFDSKINNDSLISYLLSPLVLNKKIKHILLPIINFDIEYNNIQYIFEDTIQKILNNSINSKKILPICCLQIREFFFQTLNLEQFLKFYNVNYKILIFQIIYTLRMLQDKFPEFQHNNLLLKNIYVYISEKIKVLAHFNKIRQIVIL